jgi:hypothetical protein
VSPDLAAAKRLLDEAKAQGFRFARIAPGPDGPLLGVRETADYEDEIYIGGLWDTESCYAIRRRKSSLVVPGGPLMTEQVCGDALTVLHTAVSDWASEHVRHQHGADR